MAIYIKNKVRKPGEFQFFMHQFVEVALRKGFSLLPEFGNGDFIIRIIRKLSRLSVFLPKNNKQIIIPTNGWMLYSSSIPYQRYDIIPFLWDV